MSAWLMVPSLNGLLLSNGALIAALVKAAGRGLERIGKPAGTMLECIRAKWVVQVNSDRDCRVDYVTRSIDDLRVCIIVDV
jgi:ribonucleotide monophosphatase NagD (HAD superfamily)